MAGARAIPIEVGIAIGGKQENSQSRADVCTFSLTPLPHRSSGKKRGRGGEGTL